MCRCLGAARGEEGGEVNATQCLGAIWLYARGDNECALLRNALAISALPSNAAPCRIRMSDCLAKL